MTAAEMLSDFFGNGGFLGHAKDFAGHAGDVTRQYTETERCFGPWC